MNCRFCGCTKRETCFGGCVRIEDDLCSNCASEFRRLARFNRVAGGEARHASGHPYLEGILDKMRAQIEFERAEEFLRIMRRRQREWRAGPHGSL